MASTGLFDKALAHDRCMHPTFRKRGFEDSAWCRVSPDTRIAIDNAALPTSWRRAGRRGRMDIWVRLRDTVATLLLCQPRPGGTYRRDGSQQVDLVMTYPSLHNCEDDKGSALQAAQDEGQGVDFMPRTCSLRMLRRHAVASHAERETLTTGTQTRLKSPPGRL
ncbi:hypothetical protein OE88DRAFT_1662556 [Heliocybe sulcata]|uniref:Uncharacterized protein n=1 Tax=Heliocybe sulcata TaxID=5364 RepID=A0A5C3MXX8_9AGAM|nr:hypothetical protein OE88DRAFT_1662556 [Heliocybe sulcata]